jgi:hypothetical protein
MRKGTLFLSAALTAFILSILVGVVSGYQKNGRQAEAAAQAAAPQAQTVSEPVAAAPAPVFTPQQASALASQVLGRTDLYSVETADFNGQTAYLVTFTSGDIIYVSMDGQILSISHIVPTIVTSPVTNRQRRGDNTNPPPPSDDHHEDHEDEHEDH